MHLWTDETNIPEWLIYLLGVPSIPEELRTELLQARKEIDERGAATYPTKARVEYYLHHYHDYLSTLLKEPE